MPTFTMHDKRYPIEYATENEVLSFANALRRAGGANALDALMPSVQSSPGACLVANALNFGCSIVPEGNSDSLRGEYEQWVMYVPNSVDVEAVAGAVNCFFRKDNEHGEHEILLPRRIANAAHAFDEAEDGWTLKYRKVRGGGVI